MIRIKRSLTAALSITFLLSSVSSSYGYTLPEIRNNPPEIKNVILLIADGMSNDGITLTRWYNSYNEETGQINTSYTMALDEMASGLVRTYWRNNDIVGAITDSAPGGTAYATGHKTNDKFIGVTPNQTPLISVLESAKSNGKATGIISTSQVMHATPAAFSSHIPDRSKEYIIAEQQVYNQIDLVMGGGENRLINRPDSEDLISVLKNNSYQYITQKDELASTRLKTWGMFAPMDLSYDMDRMEFTPSQPSLSEMTGSALNALSKNKDGFFLMVEGSKIDWAAHANDPIGLISDINAFDQAVKTALDYAKERNDTMVIAVTDHGNGGVSIGNQSTSSTYSQDSVARFIAPLKKATLTGEGIEKKLNEDRSNVREVMATYYGINDLSNEEVTKIINTKAGSMNYTVGPMISQRAGIGWTSTGHTGEDIVLYTYLPNNQRITGLIENTDIPRLIATLWNFNLDQLTGEHYINANSAFAAKAAEIEIDQTDENNPVLIVRKNDVTIKIPENKNYIFINDTIKNLDTVIVQNNNTFYVPQEVLNIIQ